MGKTIMILVIAVAFVAGSIMSGTMAFGAGDKKGQPFEALWEAIHNLEAAVASIPAGPQGEQGEQGEQGPEGPQGPASSFPTVYTNTGDRVIVGNLQVAVARANCVTGDTAIAPSWEIRSNTNGMITVEDITIVGGNARYLVQGFQDTSQFTAKVICADTNIFP